MVRISNAVVRKANEKLIQASRMGQVLVSSLPNEKTEKEIRDAFRVACSAAKLRNDSV